MYIKEHLTIDDFKSMAQLESKYYSSDFITPAEDSYDWYKFWSHSVKTLFDQGTLVGFINLFPISQNLFNDISSGSYNDKYLTYEDIEIPVQLSTVYHLFLSCVVIDEKYRHSNALHLLLNSYIDLYDDYIKEGFHFESVITDNVTEKGVRFSSSIGLEVLCQSDHQSTICSASYESFKRAILNRRKRT